MNLPRTLQFVDSMPGKDLFPTSKSKREDGVGISVGYTVTWRGCNWHPLVAPAQSLKAALAGGTPLSIAAGLEQRPAIFEIAIAPKDKTSKRVEVFIDAAPNLAESVKGVLDMKGQLKGCIDHALKQHHCIWIRYKCLSSYESAEREKDKILDKFDYAWVDQQYARARTLTMKPTKFCGCCCHTGFEIIEGPPRLSKQETSSFKMLMGRR